MNLMNHLSWAINLAQEGKKMFRLTNTKWAKGNQLNRGQGGCTRCPRQEFVPQPSFPSSHDPFDNWSVLSWSFLVRFPNCHECHFQEQVGRRTCLGLSWSMVGHYIVTESLMLSHVTICCFSSKVLFAVVEPDYACLAMSLIWWFTGCALVSIKRNLVWAVLTEKLEEPINNMSNWFWWPLMAYLLI